MGPTRALRRRSSCCKTPSSARDCPKVPEATFGELRKAASRELLSTLSCFRTGRKRRGSNQG
eukprot:15265776-Alexandrium_andersonii.AAC.1